MTSSISRFERKRGTTMVKHILNIYNDYYLGVKNIRFI